MFQRFLLPSLSKRFLSTTTATTTPPKTAIVMLNMGGPNDLEEVGPFLKNLFSDGEIISIFRSWM